MNTDDAKQIATSMGFAPSATFLVLYHLPSGWWTIHRGSHAECAAWGETKRGWPRRVVVQ